MALLERAYLNAVLKDLAATRMHYPWLHTIQSIYLGGGTPSLFTPQYWTILFTQIRAHFTFSSDIEITMEISPKTDLDSLLAFQAIGINRFSVGLQSFNPLTLSTLGREHNPDLSYQILENLSQLKNIRVNVDLMYGLQNQSIQNIESDLQTALNFPIHHLSWYELMIEPNTKFALNPAIKAHDDRIAEFEAAGQSLLAAWEHYEVSAYCLNQEYSRHNILYWTYGDYLGLGAGAHSKVTLKPQFQTRRFYKTRFPQDFVKSQREITDHSANEALDFLIGRLRLFRPLEAHELYKLSPSAQDRLALWWDSALDEQLIQKQGSHSFSLTELGKRSINSILEQFMEFQSIHNLSK